MQHLSNEHQQALVMMGGDLFDVGMKPSKPFNGLKLPKRIAYHPCQLFAPSPAPPASTSVEESHKAHRLKQD